SRSGRHRRRHRRHRSRSSQSSEGSSASSDESTGGKRENSEKSDKGKSSKEDQKHIPEDEEEGKTASPAAGTASFQNVWPFGIPPNMMMNPEAAAAAAALLGTGLASGDGQSLFVNQGYPVMPGVGAQLSGSFGSGFAKASYLLLIGREYLQL